MSCDGDGGGLAEDERMDLCVLVCALLDGPGYRFYQQREDILAGLQVGLGLFGPGALGFSSWRRRKLVRGP